MSYAPLLVVLGVLTVGAGITLAVLFRADRAGLFRRLSAGATVLFDEAEPMGRPQDQLFAPDVSSSRPAEHAQPGRQPSAQPPRTS